MAKLKKGSEAAKAWGRKMKALRNSKSKANINKPVLNHNGKVKPKMSKKDRRGKSSKRAVHLLPDLLEVGGVAYPFIDTQNTGYSAASGIAGMITGPNRSQAAQDAVYNLKGNLATSAIPSAELIVGGLVVKWIGKKFGLNRIGTKEVKLF